MELEKSYQPSFYEEKTYKKWEDEKYYQIDTGDGKRPFSIVMPPPNITGKLHMGHALNNLIQDILIRYNKFQGKSALWIPGMDHAGIATHTVVEKKIAKEQGLTRWDMGRDAFVSEIWKWKREYGDFILKQLKKMVILPDWSKERFTLDDGLSNAVYKVFEELFNEGLIYRGKYMVNWCPRCHTALADTEVEHKEEHGHLWYLKYPLKEPYNDIKFLIVATTRPETMLGDSAVAVNPDDERFNFLIGKTLILPLQKREIPIIGDKMVDMEFGTGAVKVTPAHDPNDYEMGKNHNLPFYDVIDDDGMMTGDIPHDFINLSREDARILIVRILEKKGYIEKIEDYTHAVSSCYRCNTSLEPLVSTQWFVKMDKLAKPAIEAIENGDIKFYPEKWKNYYLNWMYNIRDWCISRQLWWGHRIPVFYCDDCDHQFVAKENPGKCPKCGSKHIHQDEDVLDTWFSSALWPFSTMGWPEKSELLDKYYPTSVIVTDRGIIFNWIARMIMMGLKFMGKKPFKDIYIHGTILDEFGRKMSKSLGNGIDPIEMVDRYGVDAVRFSLINLTTFGQDINLSENKFEMGRNFANKIWNAFRFIFLNVEPEKEYEDKFTLTNSFDKWIFSRFNDTLKYADKKLKEYNFNEYSSSLYHFFWNEFCDWYIEATKDKKEDLKIISNLLYILKRFLIYLHPIMPVITEVLYSKMPKGIKKYKTILDEKLPDLSENDIHRMHDNTMENIINWITGIRRARKDFNISPKTQLEIYIETEKDIQNIMLDIEGEINRFAGIEKIEFKPYTLKERSINVIVNKISATIPAEKYIDIKLEKSRLEKQKEEIEKFIMQNENKLKNENFIKKAPQEVVEGARLKLEENKEIFERILKNLESLS
ncbi:valine--tRNA ligase [bacterium]|nr:valine--tRNA ligase [bacterium]